MEEATRSLILINDAMFLLMVLLLKTGYTEGYVSHKRIVITFIILALFCLFPFCAGDYWHYAEVFHIVKTYSHNINLENIYLNIINLVSNYHIFRAVVWGAAIILLLQCFKLSSINVGVALFFFVTRYILTFSYARVSLSMVILFCGLLLIGYVIDYCYGPRKLVYFVIGLLLIFTSLYFHKSAVFGIGISVLSILMLKQNKFTITLTFIAVPIMIFIISSLVNSFVELDLEDNEFMLDKAYIYLERGGSGYVSFTKSIQENIWRFPNYICAFMCIKAVTQGYYSQWPTSIKLCTNAAFLCTLISTLFLFVSDTFFFRFSNFSMVPSIIFISYCYINGYYLKEIKWYFWLSLIGVLINLAYKTVTV